MPNLVERLRKRADPAAPNNIWFNLIHDWNQQQRDEYLQSREVAINPVAKALCRSGECMCGTTQSGLERAEAAHLYPEWGKWLDALEAEVKVKHGWGWDDKCPIKRKTPNQLDLFQPACVACLTGAETIRALSPETIINESPTHD